MNQSEKKGVKERGHTYLIFAEEREERGQRRKKKGVTPI